MDKAAESLRIVQDRLSASTSSATHEIVAISNASKVDAIFQPKGSSTGGTQIQLKAASSTSGLRSYTFQNAGGYDGMLVVLVALDRHYIWVVPGKAIDKKHISVSIGSSRDVAWRVEDMGSVLRRCFCNSAAFPHMSVHNALLMCGSSNKVEEHAHLQLAAVLRAVGFQLQKSTSGTHAVDSVFTGPIFDWDVRVQEKSCHRCLDGRYQVNLRRRGGVLGYLAYRESDFDVLIATVLADCKLDGFFMIPVHVLRQHGLVCQKPACFRLYPPWALPKLEARRRTHAWQLECFLDFRDWAGGDTLPRGSRERLLDLLRGLLNQNQIGSSRRDDSGPAQVISPFTRLPRKPLAQEPRVSIKPSTFDSPEARTQRTAVQDSLDSLVPQSRGPEAQSLLSYNF